MNLMQAMSKALQEFFGLNIEVPQVPSPISQNKTSAKNEKPKARSIEVNYPPDLIEPFDAPPRLKIRTPEEMMDFSLTNRKTLNSYFFKRIKKAIFEDLPEVFLFNIGTQNFQLVFLRNEYVDALQCLEAYFLKTEQYELIAECRELVAKHNVNSLIRQSKN